MVGLLFYAPVHYYLSYEKGSDFSFSASYDAGSPFPYVQFSSAHLS